MKDQLRAATLGANVTFKRESVTINGVSVEVVQPTLQQRGDIRKKATKFSVESDDSDKSAAKMDFDITEMQLHGVIELTVVPGTNERVFSATDIDELRNQPCGGWFDDLSAVAIRLLNVTADKAKKD